MYLQNLREKTAEDVLRLSAEALFSVVSVIMNRGINGRPQS